jgi:hypothetical protein
MAATRQGRPSTRRSQKSARLPLSLTLSLIRGERSCHAASRSRANA